MPQDQNNPRQILTNDDGQPAVDMAQGLRRIFEADPAGAVQPQVEFKLTELLHRGVVQDPAQEGDLRRLLTRHYQTEAGIADPRRLSNQRRAELALAFRDADPAGRIDLLKALESDHGSDLPAATNELFEALPQAERPGARSIAARFLADREAGVEPLLGAQLAGLPEDLRAFSEQVAAEEAGENQPLKGRGISESTSEAALDEQPVKSAELQPRSEAAAFLANGLAITSNWSGPAFTSEDTALLAETVDSLLTAERDNLPRLIEQARDVFGDDPETVQRLELLAHMRFAEPGGLQGQLGVGPRQEAERELRLFRDRLLAGEDYHRQRHADRAAFAELEAVSGLRLELRDDGSIAIVQPSTSASVVVPWSVAGVLARNPDTVRKRLALIDRFITSTMSDDDLAREIDHSLRLRRPRGNAERPGAKETRKAIMAAREAIQAREDPAAVRAGLIGVLFPEIHQNPVAWGELLLDVLPIIGEVRAAIGALESFDAMSEALESGDLEEAKEQGLLTLLNTAGVVPVAGPLFKALRTGTKRALQTRTGAALARNVPVFKAGFSSHLIAKSEEGRRLRKSQATGKTGKNPFPTNPKMTDVFADVLPKLSPRKQQLLRGLWSHLLGQPAEKDFKLLLRNAGFNLAETPNAARMTSQGIKANFDAVSRTGFSPGVRLFTDSLVFPTLGARGTIFEFKLGGARLRSGQAVNIGAVRSSRGGLRTIGNIHVEDAFILRHDFVDVPEDLLESEARRLLGNHANGVRSRHLTNADVDELVDAFIGFHRQLRRQSGGEMPNLAEAFAALGIAAQARAAEHAIEAKFEEADMETGPSHF